MENNAIVGILMIVSALGLVAVLVGWSKRSIDRINDAGPATVRQIRRGIQEGNRVGPSSGQKQAK